MASPQNKGYLVYPCTSLLPMPTDQDVWPHCAVAKDSFWTVGGEQKLGSTILYEGDGEAYQTPFGDNDEGKSIFINPQTLLEMQVEKAEAAWSTIHFASKSQSSQSYDARVKKVMIVPKTSNKMLSVKIKKAWNCSRILSIVRVYGDLELLVLRWSEESHTFVATWREFVRTLEEVLDIMALSLYGESNVLDLTVAREDKEKL